jgi:LCP family protein required for cell wall assembly
MLSVYRDTVLDIQRNIGFRKANAAYANGGYEQALEMLNANLDLNIQEFVAVDWAAVATTVDLLGGIEVEVSAAEARATNRFIPETAKSVGKKKVLLPTSGGKLTLDGVQATTFARIRKGVGDDFARTDRQRLVIEKMVDKTRHSNLATINRVANEVFPMIKTSLGLPAVIGLAKDSFSYQMGENKGWPFEIVTTTMPMGNLGHQSVIVPKDLATNVVDLHAFLYGEENYKVSDAVKEISDRLVQLSGVVAPPRPAATEPSDSSDEQ